MRYQITFTKAGPMRFTGHLDLHKTLERTMRRANLPVVYSEGFNPRPKLQLASALPLGYTSEAEVAEFWLKEPLPLEEVAKAFKAAAPPGLELLGAVLPEPKAPKPQNALQSAEFAIRFKTMHPGLEDAVAGMLAAETLPRVRVRKGKKKNYDLRPLLLDAPPPSPEPVMEMPVVEVHPTPAVELPDGPANAASPPPTESSPADTPQSSPSAPPPG